jgi:hypothetical protein
VDFHQPVDFLMIDDISLLLEFIPDVLVPIAAELLLENAFYILHNNSIVYQPSILRNCYGAWFTPPQAVPRL